MEIPNQDASIKELADKLIAEVRADVSQNPENAPALLEQILSVFADVARVADERGQQLRDERGALFAAVALPVTPVAIALAADISAEFTAHPEKAKAILEKALAALIAMARKTDKEGEKTKGAERALVVATMFIKAVADPELFAKIEAVIDKEQRRIAQETSTNREKTDTE